MAYSKDDFVEMVRNAREFLSSEEMTECSCPNTRCEIHGDCYNCVRIYRKLGNHVPRCLQHVLDNKVTEISEQVAQLLAKRPISPKEYYDYLDEVLPKDKV